MSRRVVVVALSLATAAPAVAIAQTPSPPAARNVRLCPAGDPSCVEAPLATMTGVEVELDVLVTDVAGAPVSGVPVEILEEGPASFSAGGGDSVLVTSGEDGRATVTLTALEGGESSVFAEIGPAGASGGGRGPGPQDDACEQPAGPGGSPPAGNCTSGPLRIHWEDGPPPGECDDGVDNDGDGHVDLDDPGCGGDPEGSEGRRDPEDVRWVRALELRFAESQAGRMVAFGRVEVAPDAPVECRSGVRVTISRRTGGEWTRVKRTRTDEDGWYAALVADRPGAYRASIPRRAHLFPDNGWHLCMRARRVEPHRHDG